MKIKPARKNGRVVMEVGRSDMPLLTASPIKIREILVPVDFSDCAEKALTYAIPFAKQFDARITLLHVVQLNYLVGTEFATVDYTFVEKDLRTQAARQLERLSGLSERVTCKTEVRTGQPVVEIVEAAKRLQTDLIIISTHGRTGLKHMLLGSVAENIVRHAPCPVLVVREKEHEFVPA